ncbi:hypothetical protein GW17_00008685 [Ensete ventricosum]|nr:hypothetical protein GW17_00008685 [Ensete ventricosum]RZS06243.1 hypothetical protein BHM03_00036862 [Ensete ventricosum]
MQELRDQIGGVSLQRSIRFPNSGIRAKAARRRGDQPRSASMLGRLPTSIPRLWPPYKGATGYGQGQPAREVSGARKGQRLWVEVPPVGTTACSAVPVRGGGCRTPARGYRLRPTLPPTGAAAPAAEVAAPWQGGYRWARAVVAPAQRRRPQRRGGKRG